MANFTIEALTECQPEDVWERAGYWRANAFVFAGYRDDLLETLRSVADLLPHLDGMDRSRRLVAERVLAAIARAEAA